MRIYYRDMSRFSLIILALCIATPASAALKETPESYYARLMKSCEYKVREGWRDYLLYAPNKRIDECCAESVRKMAKAGAKLERNGKCPDGYQPNALKCTSSKRWCEETKPK